MPRLLDNSDFFAKSEAPNPRERIIQRRTDKKADGLKQKTRFSVGDRVRGVRSVGTIKAVDRAIVGRYYVLWDGCSRPLEADGNLLQPESAPIIEPPAKAKREIKPRKPRQPKQPKEPRQIRPTPELHCQRCGSKIERMRRKTPSRTNDYMESIAAFEKRKHCSKACAIESLRTAEKHGPELIEEIRKLRAEGLAYRRIGERVGLTRQSVYRAFTASTVYRLTRAGAEAQCQ